MPTPDLPTPPPAQPAARKHVFISYSRVNKDFVLTLIADLQAAGVNVWIDQSGLQPGVGNWEAVLRDAIRDAYALLYVGAHDSARSNYVQAELDIAALYNLPILPLWAEGKDNEWANAAPMKQIKAQYIDLRGGAYALNLPTVIREILKWQGTLTAPAAAKPFLKRNPYKGLLSFTQADVAYFFGRETESAALLAQVTARRFVSVIGASGSGKSSLVMAGVLPQLPPTEWTVITLKPGDRPVLELANRLGDAVGMSVTEVEKDLLRPDGLGLHLFAMRLTKRAEARRLLVFVDQFEEVFTRPQTEDDRRVFLDLLVKAAGEKDGVVTVLVTMRADFYDRPMAYPDLFAQMKDHTPLPAMPDANLHDAVTRPAEVVGLRFEPA